MLGLVTADVAAPLDPDLLPLDTAMRARLGDDAVAIVSWDDASVDWTSFSAVIIRSPWDYTDRLDAFLAWVDRVDAATVLVNGAGVVRWSADKRYLADLAAEGIPIVPTTFVAPGEAAPPHEVADHVALLHAEGRTAMVQPYLDLLDERGETSHCFVVGDDAGLELSHAFRKGAILTATAVEQEGDLFAKEEISARLPSDAELAVAERTLSTEVVRSLGDVVFARVDIAPHRGVDGSRSYVVMELELIEPSFYFATDPAQVALFADRLTSWLRRNLTGQPVGGA